MAKFATNASGAMLLPNLVTESFSGFDVPLVMFSIQGDIQGRISSSNIYFENICTRNKEAS